MELTNDQKIELMKVAINVALVTSSPNPEDLHYITDCYKTFAKAITEEGPQV